MLFHPLRCRKRPACGSQYLALPATRVRQQWHRFIFKAMRLFINNI